MREIKFRAWDKVEKEMIEWSELRKIHASLSYIEESERLDARIIMQYTGLKDQDGKEIYEGDIVFTETGTGEHKFEVKYDIATASYLCPNNVDDEYQTTLGQLPNSIEVIGNIYENKDLIE